MARKPRTDADGTVDFVYDSAGRLVSEHTGGQVIAQYEYGYLDKVIQVTRGDQVTQFHYNARGMLVAKERDGQIVETFGWDGIGLLAKNETVYANEAHISGGVPLAAIDAGSENAEMQYFDSDYLGTTTAVYSASGEVNTHLASSFGAGTESGELRFTGKAYDADLDAHVFPFRNYKAEAGNWASADPAGFPDGPNQHYYAAVPTMALDPLGLAVILGSHGVVFGQSHTKLIISPDNPADFSHIQMQTDVNGDQYFTMGASSVGGDLVSDLNRATDLDLSDTVDHGEVTGAGGMADTDFINSLLAADGFYNDNVDYDIYPSDDGGGVDDGRNSNSYIHGLLLTVAAQGVPVFGSGFLGWNTPLGSNYMEQ